MSRGSNGRGSIHAVASAGSASRPFVSFAAGIRGFAYEHAAFDGYFAPKRYLLAEASTRLLLGGELGWAVESELGLGDQTITTFAESHSGRLAQRANASILYRPLPGSEWSLSGGFANVASPATISSASSRVYTVSREGRLRLEAALPSGPFPIASRSARRSSRSAKGLINHSTTRSLRVR